MHLFVKYIDFISIISLSYAYTFIHSTFTINKTLLLFDYKMFCFRGQESARGLEDPISPVVVPEAELPPHPLRVPLPAERVLQVPQGGGRAHDGRRQLHAGPDRDGAAADRPRHRQEREEEASRNHAPATGQLPLQSPDRVEDWERHPSPRLEDQAA